MTLHVYTTPSSTAASRGGPRELLAEVRRRQHGSRQVPVSVTSFTCAHAGNAAQLRPARHTRVPRCLPAPSGPAERAGHPLCLQDDGVFLVVFLVFLGPGSQFCPRLPFPVAAGPLSGECKRRRREGFSISAVRGGLRGSAYDRQSLQTLWINGCAGAGGGNTLSAATSARIWPGLTSAAGRMAGTRSCGTSISRERCPARQTCWSSSRFPEGRASGVSKTRAEGCRNAGETDVGLNEGQQWGRNGVPKAIAELSAGDHPRFPASSGMWMQKRRAEGLSRLRWPSCRRPCHRLLCPGWDKEPLGRWESP